MILADWIFLGGLLVMLILGALFGFGKILKFVIGGKIVGTIISVVLCYLFGGLILGLPFVNQMLVDLAASWAGNKILELIHLEIIIYYIVLFIIFTIIRLILIAIVKNVAETDVLPMKIFNKIGGAVLLTAFALAVMLCIFHFIAWLGGGTAENFVNSLQGSAILKPLYVNNPFGALIQLIMPKQ